MPAGSGDFTTYLAALDTVQLSGPVFHLIKKLSDGVFEEDPGMAYMNTNAKKSWSGGGGALTFNIRSAEQRGKSFIRGDTLPTTKIETKKPGVLMRAYYENHVAYYRTDLKENAAGEGKMQSYVADQIEGAREGIAAQMGLEFYGNGTLDADGVAVSGSAPLVGLHGCLEDYDKLAAAAPAAAYAGITRSATTLYFNNQSILLGSAPSAGGLTATAMMQMTTMCTHGSKSPDVWVVSDDVFWEIWKIAKLERWPAYTDKTSEIGGPMYIEFRGAKIFPSKFLTRKIYGGLLTNEHKRMYCLNTKDGFEFHVDPSDDMVLEKAITPVDQASYVQRMFWNGQLACTCPRLSGTIYWA